jgi:hypothetical protein
VLVAGSASCSPLPIRRLRPASLTATFTDAPTGGGAIAGAEYSIGAAPAPPFRGRMTWWQWTPKPGSGVYFVRLTTPSKTFRARMIRLK